jgi:hypothetical protein
MKTEHEIRQQIKGIYYSDLAEAHMINHALERIERAMEPDDDEDDGRDYPDDYPEDD